MGITIWIILVKLCFLVVNGHYRDAHYEHWMRSAPRRPVDVMTDVINDLGVQILQQYHVPGNVAFSPTGLGFVLIALYEGSGARGSKQIGQVLNLPHDRQITRIGLRDIHRRLRSYLNADGFLGGLNLNKDNTRLRPEYEDILRFYGFDFTIDDAQVNTTDSTTISSSADTTTMGTATISTLQPLMNGMTTMSLGGSTNGPAGNDTSVTSSTGTDAISSPATTLPTTDRAVPTTNSPATDGTVPTTNAPTIDGTVLRTIAPTTIDTSVDIITVNPGNSAPVMQTTPSSPGSAISSTAPIATTIEVLEMPLNTTDLPVRLSSIAAESKLSTQIIVNNVGSPSNSVINRIAGGETVRGSTPVTHSFRFIRPLATEAFTATEAVTTTKAFTTTEAYITTETVTTREAFTTTENTTEYVTLTTAEPTTMHPRTTPARSTAFTSRSTTTNSRPSTLPVRPTFSDNFRLASRNRNPITSTLVSRITSDDGSTATSESATPLDTTGTDLKTGTATDVPCATSTTDASTSNTNAPASTTDAPTSTTDAPTSTADAPTTIMDSVIGAQTLPTVESPSANSVRKRRSAEHYFSSYPDDGLWMQHLNIWRGPPEADEAAVRDSKQVEFLVNGCEVATVSAATYTAVLPFAYFPSLKVVAVEFPLDNPRYNVILFLPTERPDTLKLSRDLSSKSLRLLRKHLQPTWIRATIPSFMLKGFVTLTPYLQRLGIRDVFEPRAADLSPMTPDIGVYARDVQQSLGVNVRNYMEPDRTSSRNGLLERAGPVSFVAEHPFLYFIIDTETSVTLIAGRIDDPLNSRIL
ncbi:mucin-17-like isoform X2 [Belonocnema kinseyi]|uniref:mucin-17-like isoform X2 n=1 Tax=Belonocnema kinseyi TaxID=2817044 RepID=UPI00143DAE76|nr:mucin-17-like isoform X2 [Belonocnema kinseyi]